MGCHAPPSREPRRSDVRSVGFIPRRAGALRQRGPHPRSAAGAVDGAVDGAGLVRWMVRWMVPGLFENGAKDGAEDCADPLRNPGGPARWATWRANDGSWQRSDQPTPKPVYSTPATSRAIPTPALPSGW